MNETHTQDIDARTLIGSPAPSDWLLNPQSHAESLDEKAVALKRILISEAIASIMRRFERHDNLAGLHQATYKRWGRREIYFGSAAAILGAVILFMTDSANQNTTYDGLRYILLIVQVACGAVLVATQFRVRQQQPYRKWQEARSLAETARVELFETACGLTGHKWHDAEKPGDYPLLPLQLEYFVRYQLLVQSKYYEERGAQHQKASDQYVGVGAVLTFLAALAIGVVGVFEELGDSISIISMAALVAPILLTSKTGMSRLNQDERNAARYSVTFDLLEKRRGDLDEVRKAAANGTTDSVHRFIRSVNEIISVEHSQWLVQQTESAVEHETNGT